MLFRQRLPCGLGLAVDALCRGLYEIVMIGGEHTFSGGTLARQK
jgi:hypothetical protein